MRQAFFICIRMHVHTDTLHSERCVLCSMPLLPVVSCVETQKVWKRFEKSQVKRKILHRDLVFMLEKIVVST